MGNRGTVDQGGLNTSPSGMSGRGGQGGTAAATARGLVDTAKETAGQAYDAVTERAATTLDDKKTVVTDGLSTVADNIRQLGQNLGGAQADNALAGAAARYSDTAAQKMQDVARYFETHDVRQMVRDVEGFARRNPAIFIGAAFGLGILASRFLKSSNTGGGNYGGRGRNLGRGIGTSGAGLTDIESGQGLQMGGQDFQPDTETTGSKRGRGRTAKKTTGGNTGLNASGGTGEGTAFTPGTAGSTATGTTETSGTTGTTGGASTRNTSSTRDSITDPM